MTARVHAHQVTCPLCCAHPGDPCLSRQKNPLRWMHDERANKAAQATREQGQEVTR